jgi:hypothetical protein
MFDDLSGEETVGDQLYEEYKRGQEEGGFFDGRVPVF